MKILIIGKGGRESAIVKKCLDSKSVSQIYVAPGNAQTSKIAENINISELEIDKLCSFAKEKNIDLTIVGPESSLEVGIVDKFLEKSKNFGPTKKACEIESSKTYAKKLMNKYGIPTAKYKEFNSVNEAINYAKGINYPHVIKYDGLAAGKGVVICNNFLEMENQIKFMLEEKCFGINGKIILEEFLEGDEFTILSFVKDDKVYPLEISKDYKRAYDEDKGLNTGGMGAICPYDKIDNKSVQQAHDILEKTAKALVLENKNFCGVLYGGFINTPTGVKVIEYNARFGDPETEVVLQKLENDLIDLILDILNDKKVEIFNNKNYYVGITLAAIGYPNEYKKNFKLENIEDEDIFHMGTDYINNNLVSTGGRVLFVIANGSTLEEAREKVYKKVENIKNNNLFFRLDIGKN